MKLRVRLRSLIYLYLIVIHALFAGLAVYFLRDHRLWLLAAEIGFVVSLAAGVALVRAVFGPLRLIQTGVDFMRESDFNTRFSEVRSREMNDLVDVYNRMIDHLRQERIRNREQELFMREVLEESPSGVLTLDLDGRIASANPSAVELVGIERAALIDHRLAELATPFAEELAALPAGEARILRLQGRRRVKCQHLTFMDRGFARSFLLLDELTEELHRSEKTAYGKLIRMMSHEVNNTSGAVSSLLQSCLAYRDQLRDADRADFTGALEVAISRNAHMNEFMQGFADVVRLPPPRPRPVDVRALLEEIVLLLREEGERRAIRWVWEIEAELASVDMDPTQMEQVFLNVLKNGIEAIDHDGTITIRLGAVRDRGFVTIRDTGGGIPPHVQDQLFTPFFTTKANGQGIGLTMVQEILLAHGFDFSLQSVPAGKETEFTVRF